MQQQHIACGACALSFLTELKLANPTGHEVNPSGAAGQGGRNKASRWGWRGRLGSMREASIAHLVVHPAQLRTVFSDPRSIYMLVQLRRRKGIVYLQCVPQWLWLVAERCAFALLVASGVRLLHVKRYCAHTCVLLLTQHSHVIDSSLGELSCCCLAIITL